MLHRARVMVVVRVVVRVILRWERKPGSMFNTDL